MQFGEPGVGVWYGGFGGVWSEFGSLRCWIRVQSWAQGRQFRSGVLADWVWEAQSTAQALEFRLGSRKSGEPEV